MKIIKETILWDDITLKYFDKGIEVKWVPNKHNQWLKIMANSQDNLLFKINKIIKDDINYKNIIKGIKNLILENLYVNYKNISKGLTIYLLNINSILKKIVWLYLI